MKKRFKLSFVLMSVLLVCACSGGPKDELNKASWLLGTWENKTPEGNIYEAWTKAKDQEFTAKTYMVQQTDTTLFETVRLIQEKGGLFYIPTVNDQNQGMPVRFTCKEIAENKLVFENPDHDFPQKISYTKLGADSLIAEISGTINGGKQTQKYPMRRVK